MSDINYQEIWTLIELKRYSLAKDQIRNGFLSNPQDLELYHAATCLAWMESETLRGLELSEQGLALDPEHSELLYLRFLLLEEAEQNGDAEQIIISLIRRFPQNPTYLAGYARLMLFNFHITKARQLCDEALRLDPEHGDAQVVDVFLNLVNNKQRNAEATLQQLLREHPDSERYLRVLINLLIQNNRLRPALRLTQELIRQNPHEQNLINLAIQLRRSTHWSALPLWPTTRFGWPGSIAIWVGFIVLVQIDKKVAIPGFGTFVYIYLGWIVYTWIHAPLLERWLKFRGL